MKYILAVDQGIEPDWTMTLDFDSDKMAKDYVLGKAGRHLILYRKDGEVTRPVAEFKVKITVEMIYERDR